MYFVAIGQKIVNLDLAREIWLGPSRVEIFFSDNDSTRFEGAEAKLLHEHLMSFTNVLKEKENKSAES